MGIPLTHRNVGASLSFVDVRFPLSYGNTGLFLSHKDMGFPLDSGEVGLCYGDLGFLLGHRNEGFLSTVGMWGSRSANGIKGIKLSHRELFNQIFFL